MNETNDTTTPVLDTTTVQTTPTPSANMLSRNIDDTRVATNTNNVNPYIQTPAQATTTNNLLGGFDTNSFVKGALIGAAATYLLTNENVQKNIFKLFAKGSSMLQAGFEEIKERMEDAKAELEDEQI